MPTLLSSIRCGFGDVPLAFEVWLSVSLNLPAGFISCCASIPHIKWTSFSLPAGFACSRLLLCWKTCRFKDFALLACLNPFVWPFDDRRSLEISYLCPCTSLASLFFSVKDRIEVIKEEQPSSE